MTILEVIAAARRAPFLVLAGCVACGPGELPAPLDGGPHGDCTAAPVLAPLPQMPSFAVVLSDYSSTAVALLDRAGTVLSERWLDSGTVAPGLVAALSGDVMLPTRQRGDGSLTLIDRFGTDVVTRFCLPDGQLAGQGRTHRAIPSQSYKSNPHDVVWDDLGHAWASRFEPNLSASATIDTGTDLYQLDGDTMAPQQVRLDLTFLNAPATLGRVRDQTPIAYARPGRMVRTPYGTVVGLSRMAKDFESAAPGMVALVDLAEQRARGVLLPGVADCGTVVPVPGNSAHVVVSCNGVAYPFSNNEQRRTTAAIFQFEVRADRTLHQLHAWRAADHPDAPIVVPFAVSIGGTRVVASNWEGDDLWLLDLATGDAERLVDGEETYSWGTPAWDPQSGTLWVPHRVSGLWRFAIHDHDWEALGVTPLGLSLGLPPRHVFRL